MQNFSEQKKNEIWTYNRAGGQLCFFLGAGGRFHQFLGKSDRTNRGIFDGSR